MFNFTKKSIIVIGISIGLLGGFFFGLFFSKDMNNFFEVSPGRLMYVPGYKAKPKAGPTAVCTILGGSIGGIYGTLIAWKSKKRKDIGKSYKGGWGWKIEGGDKEHISATNEKARVGPGVHVTVQNRVRIYLTTDGHYIGSGPETGELLGNLYSQLRASNISREEYNKTMDELVKEAKGQTDIHILSEPDNS